MRYIMIILFTLLAGCAQQPVKTPTHALDPNDISHWEIQGKFSVVQPDEAVSANLSWRQYSPKRYEIALSGPLGQGSVLLSGYPDKVIYKDAHGDTEEAFNAELLLYHHTGWSLPIESLYYWARGLPDPHYPYQKIRDEQGALTHLKQHGWTLVYGAYQSYDDYLVPRKITLNYTDTKITLLLRKWSINPKN